MTSNVRIINLKDYSLFEDEVLIRVDRNTIVGSPYYLNNKADPVEREAVITQYRQYFRYAMEYGVNIYYGQPEMAAAMQRYVEQIVKTARRTRVALGCWCYPEPCHADVIKEYVEKQLKEPLKGGEDNVNSD